MAGMKTRDWKTLVKRIRRGKVTPFISNLVSSDQIFGQNQNIVETWADEIDYPLEDRSNLTRVAQFNIINSRDTISAKEVYLDFLKERLLENTRENAGDQPHDFLDTVEEELDELTFSRLAMRLGYIKFDDEPENPLRILAELPLPVYLTTGYYLFLEEALKAANKEPRTEICYWHEVLQDSVPSVFADDPNYKPTANEPLVYHLHGLDAYPASLVLSEDDYLDFLVRISQDPKAIHPRIGQAMTDSSLLLLGYNLRGWDFRVLCRGLIKVKRSALRRLNIAIQLSPDQNEDIENIEDVQGYLERYFNELDFDIYWGDSQSFLQELWQQLEQ
jgi:hypothetical protein